MLNDSHSVATTLSRQNNSLVPSHASCCINIDNACLAGQNADLLEPTTTFCNQGLAVNIVANPMVVTTAFQQCSNSLPSPKAVWEMDDNSHAAEDVNRQQEVQEPQQTVGESHVLQEAVRMAALEVEQWSVEVEKIVLSVEDILMSAEEAARTAEQTHILAEQELHTFTEYRSFAENAYDAVRDALHCVLKEAKMCEEDFKSLQLQIQTADDALMAEHASIEEELALLTEPMLLDSSDAALSAWATECAFAAQKRAKQMERRLTAAARREESARELIHLVRDRPYARETLIKAAYVTERASSAADKKESFSSKGNVENLAKLARSSQNVGESTIGVSDKDVQASHRSATSALCAADAQVELRFALGRADVVAETFREATEARFLNGDEALKSLLHHTQRRFDATRRLSEGTEKVFMLNEHTQQLTKKIIASCDNASAAKNNGDAFVTRCAKVATEATALATRVRQAEANMIASAEAALIRTQKLVIASRQAIESARAAAVEAEEARLVAEIAAQHSLSLDHRFQDQCHSPFKITHISNCAEELRADKHSISSPVPCMPYLPPPVYSCEELQSNVAMGKGALERVQTLRNTVREAIASAEDCAEFAERLTYCLQQSVQVAELAGESAREAASAVDRELSSAKERFNRVKRTSTKAFDALHATSAEANACEETQRALIKRINIADHVLDDERASVEEELHLLAERFAARMTGSPCSSLQSMYNAQRTHLLSRVPAAVFRREQQALEHAALARATNTAENAQKHSEQVALLASEAVCLQSNVSNPDHVTRVTLCLTQSTEQVSAAASHAIESNHEVRVALEETRKACDVALRAAIDLRLWKAECEKLDVDCAQGELKQLNNMPWFTQRCSEAARHVQEMVNHIMMLQEMTQNATAQATEQSQQIQSIRSETELSVSRMLDASREATELAVRVHQIQLETSALAESTLVRVGSDALDVRKALRKTDPIVSVAKRKPCSSALLSKTEQLPPPQQQHVLWKESLGSLFSAKEREMCLEDQQLATLHRVKALIHSISTVDTDEEEESKSP